MKNYLFILLALFLSYSLTAREIVVKEYNYTGPYPIQTPLLVNQTDVNGKAFSEKELLKSSIPSETIRNGGKHISTNTNGELIIPSGNSKYSLHVISFHLNSDRYQEGELEVKGPDAQEVYINNDIQKVINNKIKTVFEPGNYEVVIKYLTTGNRNDTLKVAVHIPEEEGLTATTQIRRRYSLSDVTNGKRIHSTSISPDGKYILVGYLETFPGGDQNRFVQVIDRNTGAIVMHCEGDKRSVQWMPVTNSLYYTRRGIHGKELVILNPVTQREIVKANNLPEGSFRFSPTEEYLLFTIQEKGPKERKDIQEILVPDDRQPGWRNRMFIHKYDLATGLFQRVTYGYQTTFINDISKDGRYLLISTREPFLTERPFSRTTLYCIDLQTMHTDTLMKSAKFVNRAQFSPDGKKLLISGSGDAFDGAGLKINKEQTSNTSDGQLFLYDIASRSVTPLTKDFNPSVDRAVWNSYDNMIYLAAKDKDCVRIYSIHPDKGTIRTLATKEDVVSEFHCSTNAPEMVYYGMSASNSLRLYGHNLKKDASVCIVDLSKEILKDIQLGEVKDWNFISEAGDTIYGRYYLPPNFDPNKKYPLIVNYYGGTTPTARVLESRYPSHVYAAMDFVVYIVQPSGATGFGQEFSARHVNAWGKQTAEEIIEGTMKFCDTHPFINKEKVGCMGASYGGFMTMYLQTKTDIFAAAMSHAGISDITSYWGEGYWGYSYSALATANSYPWNARDIYVEQSPLFHADKINTPILFLHGAADTNVPVGESIQMFTALKLLGKPTAFVSVPDQDHHILDYNKRIRWNNTIYAWFSKWLKDQPEWWEALYPEKEL